MRTSSSRDVKSAPRDFSTQIVNENENENVKTQRKNCTKKLKPQVIAKMNAMSKDNPVEIEQPPRIIMSADDDEEVNQQKQIIEGTILLEVINDAAYGKHLEPDLNTLAGQNQTPMSLHINEGSEVNS